MRREGGKGGKGGYQKNTHSWEEPEHTFQHGYYQ